MKHSYCTFSKVLRSYREVMENTNPESFPFANSSSEVVDERLGRENNFENTVQNSSSTADVRGKDGGYKERNLVKQICRFYISQNYCRFGRNCKFSHDRSHYVDNRNSEREHNISLPGDLNTTSDSKQINNAGRHIRKKPETGVKNQTEKGTVRAELRCQDNLSSKNKCTDNENDARQGSDIPADLTSTNANVETLSQTSVVRRQRNLFFYRSNRGGASNSPAFRTRTPNHCRYFVKGFCRQGDKCKFVHQENSRGNAREKTETKEVEDASEKNANEICNNLQLPNACGVPVAGRLVKLQGLDQNEIARLRNTEIQQLKKRFPAHKIKKTSPEEIFNLSFSPSDPDWSFAVNSVSLEVVFPAEYPREACEVKISEANNLPPILVRYLNKSISDWIKGKHESCLALGKVELLFRPFLRWLDRNLEELFIVGLRKVKQDLLAREAGIEFVPYDELPGASSVICGETQGTKTTEHSKKDKPDDSLTSPQESNDINLSDKEQSAESSNVKYVQEADKKETPVCSTVEEKEVISELEADYSSTNAEKGNFFPNLNDLKFTPNRENDSLLVSASLGSDKFSVPKVGTEVKLLGLELTEGAAAMVCTKVAVTLQCSRCKTRHEINTPPKRNNSLNCIKCHHLMQIAFQPAVLHQFSTVMGYLHLVDSQAVDIPLMECKFHVDCLNCSRQISISIHTRYRWGMPGGIKHAGCKMDSSSSIVQMIKGIHYGQQRVTWCLYCNKKICIFTQSVKFQQLQPAPNIATTGHKLATTTKKEKKVIKDPAIQEGKPLPDCGTCKHYKKSYRWLRFPCCGKTYPCDICHDENETDHEMKYASRMICGFCAKEQPYAGSKPCDSCSSNMTKKAGSHWEGGKGCRDKITMSREDHQKYSGMGKTVSRKAQSQKHSKK